MLPGGFFPNPYELRAPGKSPVSVGTPAWRPLSSNGSPHMSRTRAALYAATLLGVSQAGAAEPPQEEVIVTGTKDPESTQTKKETETLFSVAGAATDPLQAIYSLPGVTFSSNDGPGGSEPVIRGSAPHDNAYFIDLIPASYIFHLFGNSIFDKHIINSFDLHPAAFSSKYGNATGGIIDVTLREPSKQDFTTTLHTSLLTAGAMVETGIGDNQAIYATYRRSTMDLLLDERDIDDDDDEGFTIDELPISDDYQLKYSWQP